MTAALSGMLLSLSLIIAIGPQNAHVLRMGLLRQHVGLTVAACAITDVILIAVGVAGLAQLGNLSKGLLVAIMGAAILFLLHYGWGAARRAWANQYAGLRALPQGVPATRIRALSTALAFSWLNPHAWLDTAVLIGTASLAYRQPNNWMFGAGAAAGSALMMWGTALWLAQGLYAQQDSNALHNL